MINTQLILKRGREKSILRRHPWIFSGAIHKITGSPSEGDVVKVISAEGKVLGIAHYQEDGSISGRILSFEDVEADQNFYDERLRQAWGYRMDCGFTSDPETNSFRLIFGEGDQLPGLIIDKYDDTAVMQCHSSGMQKQRMMINQALLNLKEAGIRQVYYKAMTSKKEEHAGAYLTGSNPNTPFLEYGIKFLGDWETGQKTGFFLDQRDNRVLLRRYAKDRKVLNTFSYTGGFTLYALAGGAKEATSVDISEKAIVLSKKNAELNGMEARHRAISEDVFLFLQSMNSGEFDLIVLDPPAFAKSHRVSHNAIQGYKRLNEIAIRKIAPGGIIFTFSCSQVIDTTTFGQTIMAAAIEAGREIRIMHHLSQPADHPVNIYHPEGQYLKGLVLYVS